MRSDTQRTTRHTRRGDVSDSRRAPHAAATTTTAAASSSPVASACFASAYSALPSAAAARAHNARIAHAIAAHATTPHSWLSFAAEQQQQLQQQQQQPLHNKSHAATPRQRAHEHATSTTATTVATTSNVNDNNNNNTSTMQRLVAQMLRHDEQQQQQYTSMPLYLTTHDSNDDDDSDNDGDNNNDMTDVSYSALQSVAAAAAAAQPLSRSLAPPVLGLAAGAVLLQPPSRQQTQQQQQQQQQQLPSSLTSPAARRHVATAAANDNNNNFDDDDNDECTLAQQQRALWLRPQEQSQWLQRERAAYADLFAWWQTRHGVRCGMRAMLRLTRTLYDELLDALTSVLTREERHWLDEHTLPSQPRASRAATMTTRTTLRRDDDGSSNTASACGVVVPLDALQRLFASSRRALHERAVLVLLHMTQTTTTAHYSNNNNNNNDDDDVDTSVQRVVQRSVARVLTSERVLVKELNDTAHNNDDDDNDDERGRCTQRDGERTTQRCVRAASVYERLLLTPLVRLEAATAVALLWKVLRQFTTVVPGVSFALHVYTQYVLPHVYEHWHAHAPLLPLCGDVSSHVVQLARLPLRWHTHTHALTTLAQAKADVAYAEHVLKTWALRSWRACVRQRRVRAMRLQRVCAALAHARRQRRLCGVFAAWRLTARSASHTRSLRVVAAQYRDFLARSTVAAQVAALASTTTTTTTAAVATCSAVTLHKNNVDVDDQHEQPQHGPSAASPSSVALLQRAGMRSRAHVIATRLAETATHTHGQSYTLPPRANDNNIDNNNDDDNNNDNNDNNDSGDDATSTFAVMLRHLRELEEVCAHLRAEVAIEARRARSLEAEVRTLRARNRSLEADVLQAVQEKLHYCNVAQEKQLLVDARDRQVAQLKSRLRAHAHRPWQCTLMRVVGEMCGASTLVSEYADELRIERDRSGPGNDHHHNNNNSSSHGSKTAAEAATTFLTASNTQADVTTVRPSSNDTLTAQPVASVQQQQQQVTVTTTTTTTGSSSGGDTTAAAVAALAGLTAQQADELEQQRLFGKLAPIVIASTRHMPDALVLLQDWANACLDDLQSLDDLKGGALSVRFGSFSEEARSGILFSRLLYYLALPRYLQRSAQSSNSSNSNTAATTTTMARQRDDEDGDDSDDSSDDADDDDDAATEGGRSSHSSGNKSCSSKAGSAAHTSSRRRRARRTAAGAATTSNDGGGGASRGRSYPERRQQLLQRRNVQLDAPFPIYADCFGDLLNLRPSERMRLLLQFATELVEGEAHDMAASGGGSDGSDDGGSARMAAAAAADDAYVDVRRRLETAVYARLDATAVHRGSSSGGGATAARVELQEVVDAHALAMGERAAVVTFVALLYVRFAHPFNHKSRQSAALERAAMLYLLSDGKHTPPRAAAGGTGNNTTRVGDDDHTNNRNDGNDGVAGSNNNMRNADATDSTAVARLTERLLSTFDDADKTPWQLFKERCLPLWGTAAHPMLLRGNFWPSCAFDSPQLAQLLGQLGAALQRSLQLHRWHVTVSCLVPVTTFSGLSRGVFTGPRASPAALRVGLERASRWSVPLHARCLARVCARRRAALRRRLAAATPSMTVTQLLAHTRDDDGGDGDGDDGETSSRKRNNDDDEDDDTRLLRREHARLLAAMRVVSTDLLSVFLRYSTLSAELALPTLDLGGWRLLCADLRLIELDTARELHTPLDVECVSVFYHEAVLALNEAEQAASHVVVVADKHKQQPPQQRHTAAAATTTTSTTAASAMSGSSSNSSSVATNTNTTNTTTTSTSALVPLPKVHDDMTYAAFLVATVLLADCLYPDVYSDDDDDKNDDDDESDSDDDDAARDGRYAQQQQQARPSSYDEDTGYDVVVGDGDKSQHDDMAAGAAASLRSSSLPSRVLVATLPPLAQRHGAGGGNNSSIAAMMTSSQQQQQRNSTSRRRRRRGRVMWLGDALRRFVFRYVTRHALGPNYDDARCVLRRLTMGVDTQEVLAVYSPAILLVFSAYSRDVFGVAGLETNDLLRLLRDAMLTSTEISQYLIVELFAYCAVTRRSSEEAAVAKRHEIDGRPRDAATTTTTRPRRAGGGGAAARTVVQLVTPSSSSSPPPQQTTSSLYGGIGGGSEQGNDSGAMAMASSAATSVTTAKMRQARLLTYECFLQFLCLLCTFKQPNPLIPYAQRLRVFLRRMLLRPLAHRVEGLAALLNRIHARTNARATAASDVATRERGGSNV